MKLVYGAEAAVLEDTLVIADLHLGMERGLFRKGIRFGGLADFLIEKTLILLRETGCRRLAILGDVKENVVGVEQEVFRYFDAIRPHAEITVCRGNHDGNLERVPGIKTAGPGGLVLHGAGLFHGHAWPSPALMRCRTMLMGHNHPQLTFFEGGKKEPRPVWLFCPPDRKGISAKYGRHNPGLRLVLMPSFNPLLGNDIGKTGGLGPVFRNGLFSWGEAAVYSLNGARLGTVREIARA
ncbi:MAG: hypothetical protein AB1657_00735 [Candidatus Micrarchaeota archaeon]